MKFSLWSFVSGCMLGAILTASWFSTSDSGVFFPFSTKPFATSTPSVSYPFSKSGAVSVSNQPSGTTITVESVTVPPPGVWVAVREAEGGALGNVLGATRVNGPRTNIAVSLLRSTDPLATYAVELYRDNGDSVFTLADDSVYVDFSTGSPAIAYFKTTQ